MPPSFLFKVQDILARDPQIHDSSGYWSPPVLAAGQYYKQPPGQIYRWNPQANPNLSLFNGNTQSLTEFKKATVYHCGGRFWIVPYDATLRDVDGTCQNQSWQPGWKALTFHHSAPHSVSSVDCAGPDSRLATQTPYQSWREQLFPEGYWAKQQTGGSGGLQGELCLVLALAAFSVRQDQLETALSYSFRVHHWEPHNQQSGRM